MAARADSPSSWAAGLGLRGLWRVGLVGGVTAAVVTAWALLGPADAPPVVSIMSDAPVLERAPAAVVEAEPVVQPANETAVVAEPIAEPIKRSPRRLSLMRDPLPRLRRPSGRNRAGLSPDGRIRSRHGGRRGSSGTLCSQESRSH